MILTDTPQKELLKRCKKAQKAPKRKAKNSRKRLYSNESSNVDEIQILLSDHSSDNFSDPCDVEKNLLVPDCTNEPGIGDYVLGEFKTRNVDRLVIKDLLEIRLWLFFFNVH